MLQLRKPYLVFLGDVSPRSDAKTGFGLRDWCRADVLGECALPGARVSLDLPRMSPVQAAESGAGSIVIGVAPAGGQLPAHWIPTLVLALEAGLDVVSGMHTRLEQYSELVAAAGRSGARLVNVRHSERAWPVQWARGARAWVAGCSPWARTARWARSTRRWPSRGNSSRGAWQPPSAPPGRRAS